MAIQRAIQKSGILSPWRNPLDPGDRFYRRVSAITRAIMNFNGTQWAESAQTHSVLPGDDFEAEVVVANPDPGFANDVKPWLSMTESITSNKAFHFGRIDGDKIRASFWGDDLDVDLAGLINWSQINRFTFTYSGATRTQTLFLNYVEIGSSTRTADVNINIAPILINKYKDTITTATYFNIRMAINGSDVIDLKIDQPDTDYQRNYASAITDSNDPDWSGAILQNVLPGDWEEIYQKSGDDFWTGDGGLVIEYAEGAL